MMKNVEINIVDTRITIDFSKTGLNLETLAVRARQSLPLLYALLSADDARSKLTDDELTSRGLAYLAMNMMCQSATISAIESAQLLLSIANGRQSISNHGFPEFEGGLTFDI